MKDSNIKFGVLFLFLVVLFSCKNEAEPTLPEAEKERIVKILSMNIRTANNGPSIILSSKLIKIEDHYYLKVYHDDKVTTTLLKTNEDSNTLVYAKVSCTSKICSDNRGCFPDTNKNCIKCSEDSNCSRTVTSSTD